MKKKKLGKDKNPTVDENVFEKLLTKAAKQLPFSPKKSEKTKRQTSSR